MHQPAVTLYTKPGCQPCRMTKIYLDKHGATYTEVDVTTDPAALAFVKGLGYEGVPVLYVAGEKSTIHWHGLRKDNIDRFIVGTVPG